MRGKRRISAKFGPLEVLDTRAVPAVFTTGPGVPGSGFDPTPLSAPFHPVLRSGGAAPAAMTTSTGTSGGGSVGAQSHPTATFGGFNHRGSAAPAHRPTFFGFASHRFGR